MNTRVTALAVLVLACLAAGATAEYADYVYVAPQQPAKRLPPQPAESYLAGPYPLSDLEADPDPAPEEGSVKATPWVAGTGADVSLDADTLFGPGFDDGGAIAFAGALRSQGARGIRLQADLSNLNPGDELWELSPGGAELHGPFTTANAPRWLPTIFGDTAVLMVRAPGGALPPLRITAFVRLYLDPRKSEANSCHPSIACEADPALQKIAAGVGTLVMSGHDSLGRPAIFLCTGALVNNPLTDANEPLLLTANHCFNNGIEPADVEVLWDQRFANCDELSPPPGGALRSNAVQALVSSTQFDAELLSLDQVPVGQYGRCWLGWDTAPPAKNDDVYALHQPLGHPLEVSLGYVTNVGVNTLLGHDQVEVKWRIGYTDSGSSGSPGVLPGRNYRIFGALSNGYFLPSCDNENDLDHYAAMSDFFTRAQPYLYTADPSDTPATPEPATCPISWLFGSDSSTTKAIRAARDIVDESGPLGEALVRGYYVWIPPLTGKYLKRS